MFLGVKLEDVGPDNDTKGPGRTGAVGPGGGGAKQKVHKVALYSPDNATRDATAFCFVNSTVSQILHVFLLMQLLQVFTRNS